MLRLLSIPGSPWSEKACWALDASEIRYEKRVYQPLIGEPELRLRLKRPLGRVSAPVLLLDGAAIEESFAIAKYAASHGKERALMPPGSEASIADYNMQSERGLSAGRALALSRVLQDREALLELVPRRLAAVLGSWSLAVARAGLERTLRKYDADAVSLLDHRAELHAVLTTLRADLGRRPAGEPRTLLTAFSYADIAMAQVLAFVEPPSPAHFRIGPASRRSYVDPDLRQEFADLVTWRDALYARYRPA